MKKMYSDGIRREEGSFEVGERRLIRVMSDQHSEAERQRLLAENVRLRKLLAADKLRAAAACA